MSTVPDDDRIEVGALGELRQLGSGGQGTVYAVPSQKIFNTWPAALKEYRPEVLPQLDRDALGAMVQFLRKLPFEQGSRLIERAAWPWRGAARGGTTTGFLMREVPPEYRLVLRGPRGAEDHLAQVQHLLNSPTFLAYRNIVFDDRLRLEFLRDVAETLVLFHSLSIVVGDLSPRNLLFSARTSPRCFFIDCDAMRLDGRTALAQAETPEWDIPAGEELATPAADAYKFALLAVRLFAGDQFTRDPQALARVSPELVELARRGLSPTVAERALPAEWVGPLTDAIGAVPVTPTQMLHTFPAGAGPVPAPVMVPGPPVGPMLPSRQPSNNAGMWWALGAVAVVFLIILIPVLFNAGRHAPADAATNPNPTYTSPVTRYTSGVLTNGSTAGPDPSATTAGASDGMSEVNAFQDLLSNSMQTRTQLLAAIQQAQDCSEIQGAIDTFRQVVTDRNSELGAAEALRTGAIGGDAVSARQYILAALRYSLNADRDYLAWAEARSNSGCVSTSQTHTLFTNATTQSHLADAQKEMFVTVWGPIAGGYGLTTPNAGSI